MIWLFLASFGPTKLRRTNFAPFPYKGASPKNTLIWVSVLRLYSPSEPNIPPVGISPENSNRAPFKIHSKQNGRGHYWHYSQFKSDTIDCGLCGDIRHLMRTTFGRQKDTIILLRETRMSIRSTWEMSRRSHVFSISHSRPAYHDTYNMRSYSHKAKSNGSGLRIKNPIRFSSNSSRPKRETSLQIRLFLKPCQILAVFFTSKF